MIPPKLARKWESRCIRFFQYLGRPSTPLTSLVARKTYLVEGHRLANPDVAALQRWHRVMWESSPVVLRHGGSSPLGINSPNARVRAAASHVIVRPLAVDEPIAGSNCTRWDRPVPVVHFRLLRTRRASAAFVTPCRRGGLPLLPSVPSAVPGSRATAATGASGVGPPWRATGGSPVRL